MRASFCIFEVLPDGELVWRDVAEGRESAIRKMVEIAFAEPHEFRLIHFPTNAVIATVVQGNPDGEAVAASAEPSNLNARGCNASI